MVDIGARIKMARKMNRMSQQALADRLGISKMAVSKIERGLISPHARLEAIASITELPLEYFAREITVRSIRLADWCE
jgi:transcriptional regulator with XRE-family HTH domain